LTAFLNVLAGFAGFYALGFAGFFIMEKLKAPAPAILGPLLFLGGASCFGLHFALPVLLRPCLSVVLGIMLGLRFNVKTKGLLKIILLVSAWLAVLTLLAVKTLTMLGLDSFTALFAATPGGITEIAMAALSFGTDAFAVALLQTSRMLLTLLIIPFIARLAGKKAQAAAPASDNRKRAGLSPDRAETKPLTAIDWLAFAGLGILSARLLSLLHIPASNMIGPMLAIGIYTKLRRLKTTVNANLQKVIQIGIGGMVGLSMTRDSIMRLPSYIVPIAALNLIIVGGCIVLALAVHKLTGWDVITCLIAAAPGGMSPMILLAMEMGAESRLVTVFQVLRMILVLLFTPLAGRFLMS
jgi:membrane AbrB-like protein